MGKKNNNIISLSNKGINLNLTVQEFLHQDDVHEHLEKAHKKNIGRTFKLLANGVAHYYRIDDLMDEVTYKITDIKVDLTEQYYSISNTYRDGNFLFSNCSVCTKNKFAQLEELITNFSSEVEKLTSETDSHPVRQIGNFNLAYNVDLSTWPVDMKLKDIKNEIANSNIKELNRLQDLVIEYRKTLIGRTFFINTGIWRVVYKVTDVYLAYGAIQYAVQMIRFGKIDDELQQIFMNCQIPTLAEDWQLATPKEVDTDAFEEMCNIFSKKIKKLGKIKDEKVGN